MFLKVVLNSMWMCYIADYVAMFVFVYVWM